MPTVLGLSDITVAISWTDWPLASAMKTLNSFSLSVSSGSGVRLRPASCSEICGSRKLPPWQTWRIASISASAALRLVS